jgi:hypothetical protein
VIEVEVEWEDVTRKKGSIAVGVAPLVSLEDQIKRHFALDSVDCCCFYYCCSFQLEPNYRKSEVRKNKENELGRSPHRKDCY